MPELEQMREVLEEALKELPAISVRAEMHDAYEPIHVDIGTFLRFVSPEWEVVFGKPGSGKTILLKTWEEEIFDAVERPSVLPIYVSARQMLNAPGDDGTPAERGELHFQAFLEGFGAAVREASRRARVRDSWVDRLQSGSFRRKSKVIADLLESINRAIQRGRPIRRPRDRKHEDSEEHESEDKRSFGGRLRGGLGDLGASLGVSGGAERSDSERSSASERLSGSGPMAPDFQKVTECLEELAEAIEVERFCVLLDDWSLVDVRVQPWVAAWLKRTFHGNPRIALKIVANPEQVLLWDEIGGIGLSPIIDVRDRGTLDHPQMEENDLVAFFEQLLLKRLASLQGDLEVFAKDRLNRPRPEFVGMMFETREAFELLATGTEGIPRNFLIALLELVEGGLPQDGWSVTEVREAVGAPELPIPKSVQLPEVEADEVTDVEALLEYVIRPKVVANGSPFFLVRAEDRAQAGAPFEKLLERKLVEADDTGVVPPRLRSRYEGFWLSDDRWQALGRAILLFRRTQRLPEIPLEEALRSNRPRNISASSAQPYVLDFTRWHA
jgi:hypothetical protein